MAGSIIATEISAVTLISVPATVFAPGGDLTYIQFGIGALLARVIVGVWFVRAYYEREIYSPYEYITARLGPPAGALTTGLFMLGCILGQSVRVLLTALILATITGLPLEASIWIIGALAVAWTLLGGITTVIWTDVIQFFVFLFAILAALGVIAAALPGGMGELLATATDAGKTRFWNLALDAQQPFTLWAGLIGNTMLALAVFGTDQMMAQRMFCCRGPRQARAAIISSALGQVIALLAAMVGLGLYAFHLRHPFTPDEAALVAANRDNVFVLFIVKHLPVGVTGLVIAGVFAAAISSLDSALAALAQTLVTGVYRPWHERRRSRGVSGAATSAVATTSADDLHYVRVSRYAVVGWGLLLCCMAMVSKLALEHYRDILNLALAMTGYTGGALLAALLLALLPLRADYRGIVWSGPLSVVCVFSVTWHQPWAQWTAIALSATLGVLRLVLTRRDEALGTLLFLAACGLPPFLACYNRLAEDVEYLRIAWPWNVPIGFAVAFALGWRPPGAVAACEPR